MRIISYICLALGISCILLSFFLRGPRRRVPRPVVDSAPRSTLALVPSYLPGSNPSSPVPVRSPAPASGSMRFVSKYTVSFDPVPARHRTRLLRMLVAAREAERARRKEKEERERFEFRAERERREPPEPGLPELEPEPALELARPALRAGVGGWFEDFRTDAWGFTAFNSDWQDVIFRPFELPGTGAALRESFRDAPGV